MSDTDSELAQAEQRETSQETPRTTRVQIIGSAHQVNTYEKVIGRQARTVALQAIKSEWQKADLSEGDQEKANETEKVAREFIKREAMGASLDPGIVEHADVYLAFPNDSDKHRYGFSQQGVGVVFVDGGHFSLTNAMTFFHELDHAVGYKEIHYLDEKGTIIRTIQGLHDLDQDTGGFFESAMSIWDTTRAYQQLRSIFPAEAKLREKDVADLRQSSQLYRDYDWFTLEALFASGNGVFHTEEHAELALIKRFAAIVGAYKAAAEKLEIKDIFELTEYGRRELQKIRLSGNVDEFRQLIQALFREKDGDSEHADRLLRFTEHPTINQMQEILQEILYAKEKQKNK